MVDNFSILLSHILIALSFWLLMNREDLDEEPMPAPDAEPDGFVIRRPKRQLQDQTPDA